MTKVIFKKWKDGQIIALFPEIKENNGNILSYMHIGQHGEASPLLLSELKKASAEEYQDLKEELESIGYKLKVQ